MVFVKWAIIFLVSFVIAFIIIITFSQPEFQVRVSAHLFAYQTKALPVWAYVAGALCLGILAGLVVTIYYNVVLRASLFRKDRQIKSLEIELSAAKAAARAIQNPMGAIGDDAV